MITKKLCGNCFNSCHQIPQNDQSGDFGELDKNMSLMFRILNVQRRIKKTIQNSKGNKIKFRFIAVVLQVCSISFFL